MPSLTCTRPPPRATVHAPSGGRPLTVPGGPPAVACLECLQIRWIRQTTMICPEQHEAVILLSGESAPTPPPPRVLGIPPRTSTSTSRGPAMPPRPRSVRSIALTVALLAGLLTVAGVVTQVVTTQTASADTTLCDQFASMPIQNGRYIVQNNRWGSSATQCINVTGAGFSVTQQDGTKATNGAPNSYPSIYYGCHYGNCSSGTTLPLQASTSAFAAITTSVTMTYPSAGTWDAAYDIWFDPTPRTNGQNTGAEIMVWLNHQGGIQPVGSQVATVTLAGGTWAVWE